MFWKNRIFRYALCVSITFRLAIKSDVFQMARVKFILQAERPSKIIRWTS